MLVDGLPRISASRTLLSPAISAAQLRETPLAVPSLQNEQPDFSPRHRQGNNTTRTLSAFNIRCTLDTGNSDFPGSRVSVCGSFGFRFGLLAVAVSSGWSSAGRSFGGRASCSGWSPSCISASDGACMSDIVQQRYVKGFKGVWRIETNGVISGAWRWMVDAMRHEEKLRDGPTCALRHAYAKGVMRFDVVTAGPDPRSPKSHHVA